MSLRRTRSVATLIVLLCLLSVGIATVASSGVPRAILNADLVPMAKAKRPQVTVPSVIDGNLEFGSHKVYRSVTIKGVLSNAPGAHDTTFIDCTFLGRGSNYDMYLGDGASVYDVHFVNCTFARAQNDGTNPSMITMKPRGSSTGGAGELHDITFTGCYFGAKNAEGKTGSPGMMVEIQDYSEGSANHGFYNINFTNCTFEAGNWTTIDYAGTIQGYAGGTILDGRSVVKGCLFKGMCAQGASGFGTGLTLEIVRGVRIEGNTFWRGYGQTIASNTWGVAANEATNNVITGNVFDFRVNTGITPKRADYSSTVQLGGEGDVLSNNTVYLPPRVIPAGDLFVVSPGNTSADNRVLH